MLKTTMILIAGLMIFSAPNVFADSCEQNENRIEYLGVDDPKGRIYVGVSGGNLGCGCQFFRFSPANADTDKILALLISAMDSNKVVRIDALELGQCDTGYRVYRT